MVSTWTLLNPIHPMEWVNPTLRALLYNTLHLTQLPCSPLSTCSLYTHPTPTSVPLIPSCCSFCLLKQQMLFLLPRLLSPKGLHGSFKQNQAQMSPSQDDFLLPSSLYVFRQPFSPFTILCILPVSAFINSSCIKM